MSHEYSDEEGILLVKLARDAVENFVKTGVKIDVPQDISMKLKEMSGVFVTLNSVNADGVSLRGCIGRPYPNQPLVEATVDSALDAAVNDPRFPPVTGKELDAILVDLSVLTPPKKIEYSNPEELLSLVKIGRDGLIVSKGKARGLLLPQVPVDWGWSVQEFLEHTCNKAWLPKDAWRDPDTEFMSFQAEIFGEESPGGNIIRNPKHPRC
ncbi:MAG: TIGR00296 family protein [Candidatus Thorarchaeota archaeon]|nr:MAG: TIGR00296 family protein [Candidatus Thorarchaeota archaeon]